jgi:hypothetical protein
VAALSLVICIKIDHSLCCIGGIAFVFAAVIVLVVADPYA